MRMRLPILVCLLALAPAGLQAQSFRAQALDLDSEAEVASSHDPVSGIRRDHPPSDTETSPTRARSVRRDGKTLRVENGSAASSGIRTAMTSGS